MNRIYELYFKMKDDIVYSIKNEEEIRLNNYLRISSKLSSVYRYLFIPIIILGIFLSTKFMINVNLDLDSALGKEISLVFTILYVVIFIVFIIIFYELLLLNNVFVSNENNEILVIDKLRDREIVINKNNYKSIKCERVTNMDIITLKYKDSIKTRKIYFVAKFRFLKVFDEHNIVMDIENMFFEDEFSNL